MPGGYKQQVAYGLPEVTQPCAFCHQLCCCEAVAAVVAAHGRTLADSRLQVAAFYKQHLSVHWLEETNLADLHDPDAAVNTAAAAAAANTADHWRRCWTADAVDGLLYCEMQLRLVDTQTRGRGPENPPSEVCARKVMSCRTITLGKVSVSAHLRWSVANHNAHAKICYGQVGQTHS